MINESFETINIVNFTGGIPSEIFIMPVITLSENLLTATAEFPLQ